MKATTVAQMRKEIETLVAFADDLAAQYLVLREEEQAARQRIRELHERAQFAEFELAKSLQEKN